MNQQFPFVRHIFRQLALRSWVTWILTLFLM
jgi:hypothetical protein